MPKLAAEHRPLLFFVNPGELVWLPDNWLHMTLNLDDALYATSPSTLLGSSSGSVGRCITHAHMQRTQRERERARARARHKHPHREREKKIRGAGRDKERGGTTIPKVKSELNRETSTYARVWH